MTHPVRACGATKVWTHWGLNPGPSACEADVIPLNHPVALRVRAARSAARAMRANKLAIAVAHFVWAAPRGIVRARLCVCNFKARISLSQVCCHDICGI